MLKSRITMRATLSTIVAILALITKVSQLLSHFTVEVTMVYKLSSPYQLDVLPARIPVQGWPCHLLYMYVVHFLNSSLET